MAASTRRSDEILLLEAMYPEQLHWSAKNVELKYVSDHGGTLLLRLPDAYPETEFPMLLGATSSDKQDIRDKMRHAMDTAQMTRGEEVIDAVIQVYEEILTSHKTESEKRRAAGAADTSLDTADETESSTFKTVIIWLHHLLATSKRKLALNPSLRSTHAAEHLSGITKPGYPGIMMFSGLASLVDAHVEELKHQKWQAFQVRYEEEFAEADRWHFEHDDGIVEVESMAEMAQAVVSDRNRQAFLKAVGIK